MTTYQGRKYTLCCQPALSAGAMHTSGQILHPALSRRHHLAQIPSRSTITFIKWWHSGWSCYKQEYCKLAYSRLGFYSMEKLGVFILLLDSKTQREDPGSWFKRSRVQRANHIFVHRFSPAAIVFHRPSTSICMAGKNMRAGFELMTNIVPRSFTLPHSNLCDALPPE